MAWLEQLDAGRRILGEESLDALVTAVEILRGMGFRSRRTFADCNHFNPYRNNAGPRPPYQERVSSCAALL